MGAFNRLLVEEPCKACGRTVERAYQFKYGDKWQLDYRLGDILRWGGNDEGTPGAAYAETACIPESCPACGWEEDAEYTLTVENDVLIGVQGPTVIHSV